jgi:hypothetical protein
VKTGKHAQAQEDMKCSQAGRQIQGVWVRRNIIFLLFSHPKLRFKNVTRYRVMDYDVESDDTT